MQIHFCAFCAFLWLSFFLWLKGESPGGPGLHRGFICTLAGMLINEHLLKH
jgi:hypothetical protein